MSIRYIDSVLDRVEGISSSEAFVLLILANSASDDTRECWPSIATIARRTRLDERTVRRCLRKLESLELIETATGGHQYGKNTASRYRMLFDPLTGQKLPPPVAELSTRGAPRPPRGGTVSGKGGTVSGQGGHHAPPSVIEPSLNQRGDKSRPRRKTAADRVREAYEATDEELEEKARNGTLTAEDELERERRRVVRARTRKGAA